MDGMTEQERQEQIQQALDGVQKANRSYQRLSGIELVIWAVPLTLFVLAVLVVIVGFVWVLI